MAKYTTLFGMTLDEAVEHFAPNLDMAIARDYFDVLCTHIFSVHEAARKLGMREQDYIWHDLSKLSPEEFEPYALHFKGGGAPALFAPAWLHHINNNPHHWQYWIFPDGYAPSGSYSESGVLPMPERYATEMVADWMGASIAYTGSDDMSSWLMSHMETIRLHSQTAAFLRGLLGRLGYADIVESQSFAHELDDEEFSIEGSE